MSADHLSSTFSALADPTRRAILARLAGGEEVGVMEIARPFKMSLPAVTKHLKVLEKSGLISRSRTAQWRPCKLEAGPMKEASEWLQYYRQHWEESLDRLDAYLKKLQQEKALKEAAERESGAARKSHTDKAPRGVRVIEKLP